MLFISYFLPLPLAGRSKHRKDRICIFLPIEFQGNKSVQELWWWCDDRDRLLRDRRNYIRQSNTQSQRRERTVKDMEVKLFWKIVLQLSNIQAWQWLLFRAGPLQLILEGPTEKWRAQQKYCLLKFFDDTILLKFK